MLRFLFSTLLSTALMPALFADVKLPAVLGSHMVLQRDTPLPIWGRADPGEEVVVQLGEDRASAKADEQGNWKVLLPARKASGDPVSLTVTGKNQIELTDILVGEVWVGSGQSNMEWPLSATRKGQEAIAAADHPAVRLFQVPKVQAKEPASDVNAAWAICSPKTVGGFSAVLYYFGRNLQRELGVPIGLINSSWGGSPIEPWTITGTQSGGMYNGMIAPLLPFPVRGITWYQGETNVMQKNGLAYRDKMEDLITGWRKAWGRDLPFYFVQIAPWKGAYPEGELPAVWEAQTAALKIPGTGMAATTDLVDNITDIHPQNKLDVGERLARWALTKTYERTGIVYSGPIYKSMTIEGDKARLHFAHADGLKTRDGQAPNEFELAGEDGKFVPADAVIDGTTVVVSAKSIEQPTEVRFGWRTLTNPNLVNSAGLPALPFRTKDWKGGTGE